MTDFVLSAHTKLQFFLVIYEVHLKYIFLCLYSTIIVWDAIMAFSIPDTEKGLALT